MAISEKNFQPADYQKYVERGPDSYVNWEEMSTKVTKLFTDEATRRENIKADIDDRTQSLYDQLAEVEVNKDGKWSDEVISSANQIRKALSTYNSLLKKGSISVTEYKTQMERVKGQMSELNIITKELGTSYNAHTERLAVGENGEILAAPDEIAVFNSASGYGKLKNTKLYIDPVTMNAFMYKINEDGSIPDFTKNPEKFMAINNARSIMNYTNDRNQYVVSDVAKGFADQVGTFINEKLIKYIGTNRDGTYVLSEEGVRLMESDPDIKADFDDIKSIVFEKLTAEGEKGIANTIATLDGNYIMAMSEDEFKAKGGTDLKYFIKINPDAADGMTYEFSSAAARDEAITKIEDNVSDNLEIMLGKKVEKTNVSYEPDESSIDKSEASTNENIGGYFQDLKNIVGGGEGDFSASVEDLKDRANKRLGKDGEGVQITDITREKNFITVTFVDEDGNETTKTIDRYKKDENDQYTDEKISDSVIYQKLNTELRPNDYTDLSYDDLERRANESGFSFDFEEGTYFGDETRTNVPAYTEKNHKPFNEQSTASIPKGGGDPVAMTYEDKINEKLISSSYSGQLAELKTVIPSELQSALEKSGIDMVASDFTITGTDLSGGNNEFTITYTNPYNGATNTRSFIFNSKTSPNGTNNIMAAMDEVMQDIFTQANQNKGKKKKDDDQAP